VRYRRCWFAISCMCRLGVSLSLPQTGRIGVLSRGWGSSSRLKRERLPGRIRISRNGISERAHERERERESVCVCVCVMCQQDKRTDRQGQPACEQHRQADRQLESGVQAQGRVRGLEYHLVSCSTRLLCRRHSPTMLPPPSLTLPLASPSLLPNPLPPLLPPSWCTLLDLPALTHGPHRSQGKQRFTLRDCSNRAVGEEGDWQVGSGWGWMG
jgi:hypothetical protein